MGCCGDNRPRERIFAELEFHGVRRNENGQLGLGLNDENELTKFITDEAAEGELRLWDQIVAIDGVEIGERRACDVLAELNAMPTHTLRVKRFADVPKENYEKLNKIVGFMKEKSKSFRSKSSAVLPTSPPAVAPGSAQMESGTAADWRSSTPQGPKGERTSATPGPASYPKTGVGIPAPRSDLVNDPHRVAPSHHDYTRPPAQRLSPIDLNMQRLRASGRCHTRVAPDSPSVPFPA